MSTKRLRIGAELEKARAKRDEWERRVKDLEARYNEAKKTEINDMVEAANITPEELANLIRNAKKKMPGQDAEEADPEGAYAEQTDVDRTDADATFAGENDAETEDEE